MVNNVKSAQGATASNSAGVTPGGVPVSTGRADRATAPGKSAAAAYAKSESSGPPADAAKVQISPRAREMSQIRKIVDETPDVREDKVARFKDLIAKGEYKPDAGKIADSILNEAIKDEIAKDPEQLRE